MSKEAALRAMREARHSERARATADAKPARASLAPLVKPRTAKPEAAAPPAERLCGHRSMNGRSCTREQGHAAKSHRYS